MGRGDQEASEHMYEVLMEVIRRADSGINIGYAILFEAVKTISGIYPNRTLLDQAGSTIGRFISSENPNLKYIGIKALMMIVRDYPKYASEHQVAVIRCINQESTHNDDTLKRKTLELLHRMTNPHNVEFIVEKLLENLQNTNDDSFRTELVSRITQCAERYAPSNSWYIFSMIRIFEIAGDKVTTETSQTLMQLIAEGSGEEDEELDEQMRFDAVENFVDLLFQIDEKGEGETDVNVSSLLIQTMSWVLGEYSYLSEMAEQEEILHKLANLCKNKMQDYETIQSQLHKKDGQGIQDSEGDEREYLVGAMMKIVAQIGHCPPSISHLISHLKGSLSVNLHQKCNEFLNLLKYPSGYLYSIVWFILFVW